MPYALDLRDIIDSEVDVFELLQLVEALHFGYQITLHVQNLQMTAVHVKILDLLKVLLMKRDLQ